MGKGTAISWADDTFNPWWGCMKVGPGCDHCYAEAWDKRVGGAHWGAGVERRFFGDKHWNEPRKWNREAEAVGTRRRVFCASMADVFDNEVEQQHRERLWALIRETPWLDWQLVTKRIGNAAKMLPADWGNGYPNVWLIATVVNQEEADRDIPKLLATPAYIRGLSIEPLLGPLNIRSHLVGQEEAGMVGNCIGWTPPVDWIIVGGESKQGKDHQPRPMQESWARDLMTQCIGSDATFHFKQAGDWLAKEWGCQDRSGGEPSEWPEIYRVRQFPTPPSNTD